MALLDATFYPQIRAAIDTMIGPDELPDSTIAMDAFIGEGQRLVTRKVPDATSRTGDELAQLRSAAILYTASLLAASVPLYTSEMVGHRGYQYQRVARDPQQLARDLRARAARLVSLTLNATGTPAPVFAIAKGGR